MNADDLRWALMILIVAAVLFTLALVLLS